MEELNYKELLDNCNIKKGMTVDLVVDIFNVTKVCWANKKKFDPDHFIDAVLDYIGEEGTLLIRAFNWDYCHDTPFDIRTTPSKVGALGNVAMKRDDFRRTKHPLYSWWVKGKYAEELLANEERTSFGPGSIFDWEYHNPDAVQLNIGNPSTNGISLFHYVEQKVNVHYRFEKQFTGQYTDYDGNTTTQTYSMFVRDLDYDTDYNDELYMDDLRKAGFRLEGAYEGIDTQTYIITGLCDLYYEDFSKTGVPSGVKLTKLN